MGTLEGGGTVDTAAPSRQPMTHLCHVSSQGTGTAGRQAQAIALGGQLTSLRRALSQILQSRFLPEDPATAQPVGSPVAPAGRAAPAGGKPGAAAGSSAVRVYIMQAAGELAAFLGTDMAMTTLVPMFMYLPNETNWRVRAAFYLHLPEVASTLVCRRCFPRLLVDVRVCLCVRVLPLHNSGTQLLFKHNSGIVGCSARDVCIWVMCAANATGRVLLKTPGIPRCIQRRVATSMCCSSLVLRQQRLQSTPP